MIPPFFNPYQNDLGVSPIPLQSPSQVIDRGQKSNESGILSVFSSYLSSYAADDPPEPSDEELESTLCTVDCINACFLGDVFSNLRYVLALRIDTGLTRFRHIPIKSLKFLVSSLLAQLPEENSPVVIAVKPEVQPPGGVNGLRQVTKGVVYDPTVVYVLELATVLALRDKQTVEAVGQPVAEALQAIIRDAINIHFTAVSRALYYLLSLLEASHVSDPPLANLGSGLTISRNNRSCVLLSSCMRYQA